MKNLFIYGYGYTAHNFVNKFRNEFSNIIGYTRNKVSINSADECVHFIEKNQISDYLTNDYFSHVLISIPPSKDGDFFYLDHGKSIEKLKKIQWIGYLSATNVYGDHNGRYVHESSDTNPTTQKGKNRLLAETQLLTLCKRLNFAIHIFRIAGIYGPNRNIIKKIREQKIQNIEKKNQFFSRIFIDDLVTILSTSMSYPNPLSIYNVADDFPTNINDVIEYICKNLDIPVPDRVNYLQDNDRNFMENLFSENKRVDNKLIKNEFRFELKYPSYKEGYKRLLEK